MYGSSGVPGKSGGSSPLPRPPPPRPRPPPPPPAAATAASTSATPKPAPPPPPPPPPVAKEAPKAEPLGRVPAHTLPQRRAAAATTINTPQQQQQQQQHAGSYGYAYPSASSAQAPSSPTTRASPRRTYASPSKAVYSPYGSYGGKTASGLAAAAGAPPVYGSSSASLPLQGSSSAQHAAAAAAAQAPLPYKHNLAVGVFLVPVLLFTLSSHDSAYPIMIGCFLALLLYALDLANQRDALFYGSWIAIPVMTCSSGWFWLLETENNNTDEDSGWTVLTILFQTGVTALAWIAAICWMSLQMEWLVQPKSPTTLAQQLQMCLHAIVPVVAASAGTHWTTTWYMVGQCGETVAATVAPLLFATLLTAGMLLVGSCSSSFVPETTISKTSSNAKDHDDNDNGQHHHHHKSSSLSSTASATTPTFCISQSIAFGHAALLMTIPPLMHLATFFGRILSSYSSLDDWADWFLSMAVPYLLLCCMGVAHSAGFMISPYGKLSLVMTTTPFFGTINSSNRLVVIGNTAAANGSNNNNGSAAASSASSLGSPIVVTLGSLVLTGTILATSLAVQYRYLIPAAHAWSYHFSGVQPSAWMLSFYWTLATVACLAAAWTWGRTTAGTSNNEPLFGEYQEDILQLCLAVAGLAIGKGLGMPWNFTPLSILAFLGLSLWLTSRMLRYLAIFLFVVHAAGFVAFTYRFAGIDRHIQLVFPSLQLNLTRFGMLVIFTSIIVGLVAGLAVRASGGLWAATLRKIDLAGLLLVAYAVLLLDLEITLLEPGDANENIAGVYESASDGNDVYGSIIGGGSGLYSVAWGFVTSTVLIGIAIFMKRVRILKPRSASAAISLAVGKFLTLYGHGIFVEYGIYTSGSTMFIRAIITSVVFTIVAAPNVFLEPVYLKTSSRYKRSLAGGSELPDAAKRTILIYNFVFLPIIVLVAVESLMPVMNAVLVQFRDSSGVRHASGHPSMPWILAASSVCLWAVASLAMLNHFLPDGGGEFWKKLSALAFLAGIFLFFAAPMLAPSSGRSYGNAMSANPYVAASSIGAKIQSRSKRRTGGWGLLSACLASLLAMTGVLELQEKRSSTNGPKDRFLLLRTMIFSLMFGGGVTWFIIVQAMSEADTAFLVLTMISSMTIACLGTVAAVLGYFIELEEFEEVEQLGKTLVLILPVFMGLAGLPRLIRSSNSHPFGAGGWLSTYLAIAALTTLSVATSLRCRHNKDTRTRGLGNVFCLLSFASFVSIIFGRFGVSGLIDYEVNTVLGIATPVVGTIVASIVLFGLEGDSPSGAANRRLAGARRTTTSSTAFTLPLPQLRKSNRLFPLFFGISSVFLLATLYAILLRGTGIETLLFGDFSSSSSSQKNPFQNAFEAASKSDGGDLNLASLAEENTKAIYALARLGASGLWTSGYLFGPIVHLAGFAAVVPSLLLSTQRWWWRQRRAGAAGGGGGIQQFQQSVPVTLLLLTTCFNLFPLLFCRGIDCLRAAALLNLLVGGLHVLKQRSADQTSNMQL